MYRDDFKMYAPETMYINILLCYPDIIHIVSAVYIIIDHENKHEK